MRKGGSVWNKYWKIPEIRLSIRTHLLSDQCLVFRHNGIVSFHRRFHFLLFLYVIQIGNGFYYNVWKKHRFKICNEFFRYNKTPTKHDITSENRHPGLNQMLLKSLQCSFKSSALTLQSKVYENDWADLSIQGSQATILQQQKMNPS